MTELKTLKDMEGIQNTDTLKVIKGKFPYAITSYELKQEAIKHIKVIGKESGKTKDEFQKFQLIGQLVWIQHFFNITEEDLK